MNDYITPRGVVIPASALTWKFSRSGGPGGQHVNTSSTRASLRVDLTQIPGEAGETFRGKHGDEVLIHASEERSQLQNRQRALERLGRMLDRSLVVERPRRKTRVSAGVKKRNMERKARRSALKAQRSGGWQD